MFIKVSYKLFLHKSGPQLEIFPYLLDSKRKFLFYKKDFKKNFDTGRVNTYEIVNELVCTFPN